MTATLLDTDQGLARLGADTRYVLTGFPAALTALTVCVTGFAAGLSLAVLWVGVPLLIGVMALSRHFADVERRRIAVVLDLPVSPFAAGTGDATTTWSRLTALVRDAQAWRDLAHAAVRWVPSTIAFSIVVSWWAGALGGVSWALWGWALPDGPGDQGLPELLGLGDTYGTAMTFYLIAGLLFAITLPVVVHAAARFEARAARALLMGPS